MIKNDVSFTRVFGEIRRIAHTSGEGSTKGKIDIMSSLLRECSTEESKYVVRFLQKTLKTGAAYTMVVLALARAVANTPPNKPEILSMRKKLGEHKFMKLVEKMEQSVKQALCEYPDYGEVVRNLLIVGDEHDKL